MDRKYLLTFIAHGMYSYVWLESEKELVEYANNLEDAGHQINEALYLSAVNEIEWQ